jgi:Na+-driven multidrug efflux pump
MNAAQIPQKLRADAGVYLCIILLGGGFLGIKNILITTIQGLGDTLFPALVSGIGVVTHTMLVVWLIAGCGFGVSASAAAILINNTGQAVCLAAYLIGKYRNLCLYHSFWNIELPVYVELLKNGISKSLMFVFLSVGTFVMQRMENVLSVELLAGDTYADRIYELFTEIISAYGTATVIITGQNVERGQYQTIRSYNKRLIVGTLKWSILFFVLSLTVGRWMVEVMAGGDALPEVISAGVLELRVICIGYPLLATLIIYRYALQTMGEYRAMPVFGLLEMGMNILMALMIGPMGYLAVCLAVLLKWIVPGIAAVIWYHIHMKQCLCITEFEHSKEGN